jgi:hypothetical protein
VNFERDDRPTGAVLRATGRILVFDGFLRVLGAPTGDEQTLPGLQESQKLGAFAIDPVQRFTPRRRATRGVAGQDARVRGHRPAVDLRVDHPGHPGAQVRRAARPPVLRDRPRRGRDRQADRGVPRADGRRLHALDGVGARRDRGERRRLAGDARKFYKGFSKLAGDRQRDDDPRQGGGAALDLQVPEVRGADGVPLRQERPVPVVHALPGVRLRGADHPRRPADAARARRRHLPRGRLRHGDALEPLRAVPGVGELPGSSSRSTSTRRRRSNTRRRRRSRSTSSARSAARRSTCARVAAARGSAARSSRSAAAAWPGPRSTRRPRPS